MVRRLVVILWLPVVVLLSTSVDASERAWLSTKKQATDASTDAKAAATLTGSTTKPRHYTNAKLGFTMAVPLGAEVAEREGTNQISVRSRKGYVINVQVGPKRPDVPLARMSTLLEPKYLGEGKPWSTRGEDRPMEVAGLPAHDVVYRGTGSKARVVVARGHVNDYVFIFIASERAFPPLEAEFRWALTNFQPHAQDRPQRTVQVKPVTLAPSAGPQALTGAQRFAEPGYGYTIEYPVAWKMSKPASMATMFSGREGTPDYAAIVGIQNIAPLGAKSPSEAAKRALNQLKASLGNAVRNFTVLEDRDWTYARRGTTLVGRQLLVSYKHAGVIFQKRMIVVPRFEGTVAHVWSYTAPRTQYVSLRPHAERILRSWTILSEARK